MERSISGAALDRRQGGERQRDDYCEHGRVGDERERRPQPLHDDQRHGAVLDDRLAERAVQHVGEKGQVLLPERGVETELMAQRLDVGLRCRAPRSAAKPGRPAGPEQHEGDKRYADERRNELDDPAQEEVKDAHRVRVPVAAAAPSPRTAR